MDHAGAEVAAYGKMFSVRLADFRAGWSRRRRDNDDHVAAEVVRDAAVAGAVEGRSVSREAFLGDPVDMR